MIDPASLSPYELSARVERLMTTLGERLTNLDREVLREAVRRAGERDGVVDALLDRTLQWEPQLERKRPASTAPPRNLGGTGHLGG
jgi:hypothetical protein